MIILALTVCILAGPCSDVEFKGVFSDLDACGVFADDATASQAVIPRETRQLVRVKAVSCRDEQES